MRIFTTTQTYIISNTYDIYENAKILAHSFESDEVKHVHDNVTSLDKLKFSFKFKLPNGEKNSNIRFVDLRFPMRFTQN